jgi:Protein of unknown function (DUF2946)
MEWFRRNIRHGARLALFALAVQFALSFGHFHAIAAQAAPALQQAAGAIQSARQELPASNHDSDQHPGEACAICAVIALANTALLATMAVLLLSQFASPECPTADTAFVYLHPVRGGFQPRAPPLS